MYARVSSQAIPPPDGGGSEGNEMNKVVTGVTFREKVMGGRIPIKPSV